MYQCSDLFLKSGAVKGSVFCYSVDIMRILTGIQPTNNLHIGNLFGALIPMVRLQEKEELTMMIADLHAITVKQNPEMLRENIKFALATYLACGIDPEKTIIFQQSTVPEHSELGWLMQTITKMGEAERMTQFKDKSGSGAERVSVGLFTYPSLMAADILLHQAEVVPVGKDQKQHLELARTLAGRFNQQFGDTLTVPKPLISKTGSAKILSLSEPEKKMSKSAPSAKSYISVMDDSDAVHAKIRSAVTDSEREITADEGRLGLYNLLTIFSLVDGRSQQDIARSYSGKGMKDLKDDLAEALIAYLAPSLFASRICAFIDRRR